jgi:UPF0176 protein
VPSFKVLLYYKYVQLTDPQSLRLSQKQLCRQLNLNGRILISQEGINGTIAGLEADIDAYVAATTHIPGLADMEWKISWADEQIFPKLRVVVRDEIVTLGVKKTGSDVAIENKADYIEPAELLVLYERQADFVIVDARNNYEASIGKFKNSVTPSTRNFRDFPQFVAEQLAEYKDKPVVTYCTGGVRCEKASAYLREQGFTDVRQLHGGIHEYGVKTGGKYFEGEMFVFDKRLHVPVNQVNPEVISHCLYCHTPIARYVDCVVPSCPSLFICCEKCQETHHGVCQENHQELAAHQQTHFAYAAENG